MERRIKFLTLVVASGLVFAAGGCPADGTGAPGAVGDAGPAGSPGPQGPSGAPGTPGTSRWTFVDAAGTSLDRDDLFIFDGGYIWFLDPETGRVRDSFPPSPLYYESAECDGDAYTTPQQPLQPFGLAHADPGVLFVRPPDLRSEEVCVAGVEYPSLPECNATTPQCLLLMEVDELARHTELEPPSTAWQPPLRRVLR
jgi:hypothetical protein